jgi:hypothetical protein
MPNPNAFVALVNRVDEPPLTPTSAPDQPDPFYWVHFAGGRSVRLDRRNPRSVDMAELLKDAKDDGLYAFVDLDPITHEIARLYFPHIARVTGLRPLESGDVEVRLKSSAGLHLLRRTNRDFDEILAVLTDAMNRRATLAVSETPNEHEVIDARALPAGEPNHLPRDTLRAPNVTDKLPTSRPVILAKTRRRLHHFSSNQRMIFSSGRRCALAAT